MTADAALIALAQLGRIGTLAALLTGVVIMLLVGPRTRHHWSCLYLFASWLLLASVSIASNARDVATLPPTWLRAVMWGLTGSSAIVFIVTSWEDWLRKAWRCRKPDAPADLCL